MRYLGTTDEVDACDCCGRKDLKSTVAIETDDGQTVYYGVTCAAKALKTTAKAVKAGAKAADEAARSAIEAARVARQRADTERFHSFLREATKGKPVNDFTGKPCPFLMIEEMGGYTAAREAYRANGG